MLRKYKIAGVVAIIFLILFFILLIIIDKPGKEYFLDYILITLVLGVIIYLFFILKILYDTNARKELGEKGNLFLKWSFIFIFTAFSEIWLCTVNQEYFDIIYFTFDLFGLKINSQISWIIKLIIGIALGIYFGPKINTLLEKLANEVENYKN